MNPSAPLTRVDRVTVLITDDQLNPGWLDSIKDFFPSTVEIQLFFVYTGVLLVASTQIGSGFKKRLFCGFSHRTLQGPEPLPGIESGGLLDFAQMVAESEFILSVPHTLEPVKRTSSRLKEVGVLLDAGLHRGVEGLRVATGLAGCNHRLTVFFPLSSFPFIGGLPRVPLEAKPYLEALIALNARFTATPALFNSLEYDVLLRV
ncbi:MAG: hypothetical protein HQL67_06590 [Magnetococcales bacterium]|nr:hypothetical protein [Magnetococcales bacterium]